MMNRINFKYLALGGTAALVGCMSLPSVGPDYEAPDVKVQEQKLPDAGVPPAMTNGDRRVTITREAMLTWWKDFNDPVLEKLVESVSNNVSLAIAIRNLEAAEWQLLGTYSDFLPKVNANADFTQYEIGPNTQSGASMGHRYNTSVSDLGLSGSWEIDIFGGRRRATEAALALAQAKGFEVANAWLTLTTQIGTQYINLRTTQDRILVAETNLKLQQETYDILKSRLDSGIGDELAVKQSRYVLEQTRARIPAMKAQEECIKNALAVLVGKVPGALEDELAALPVDQRRDWLVAPQKLESIPLEMIRSRPDVMASERALAAQCANIGVAKSAWYPKLFITGSVGWQATKGNQLFTRDSFLSTIGPSASWAIFDAGAIYSAVKAAEAQTAAAALGYELAIQQAYGEVRNAYAAYTQQYHYCEAIDAAVQAAVDAEVISQDLYKNGLKDFNNVLDAQRSRLTLEEAKVVARGQITLDLIELYRTLGGGLAAPDETEDK